jgi:hypothetical protein
MQKGKDHEDLTRLENLIEEKNSYLHHFKKDDLKEQEKACAHSKTSVT